MSTSDPVCVWLKRDLRVADHAALSEAVARGRGGAVFAVFLYEPEVLVQPEWDPSHTEFQRECLSDLEPALRRVGIRLVTRRGEAVAMLEQLRVETGFHLLVAHEETGTGVTYARDRRVRQWARDAGVEFVERPQTGVVRRLASRNGWNRLWEARMEAPAALVPRSTGRGGLPAVERLESAGILGCRDLGLAPDTKDRQRGGSVAAEEVLDDFLVRRGCHYSGGISSPLSAASSCSRLSPHLAFGAISMRRVWQATEARRLDVISTLATATVPRERAELRAWQRSLKAVQSRLHWHCHFMQKIEDEPAIEWHNMLRAADGLREHEVSAERLAAWQSGHTGFPLVDACMQSGTTGINTLRIYNPTKQAIEQDPRGIFIRRWVPELAGVPVAHVHMPWTMPHDAQFVAGCVIGRDYPAPLVDHAAAVREAKRRLAAVRNPSQAQAEAREVARRHGSRKDRRGAMRQDPVRRRLASAADHGAGGPEADAPGATDRQQRLPFWFAEADDPPASERAD